MTTFASPTASAARSSRLTDGRTQRVRTGRHRCRAAVATPLRPGRREPRRCARFARALPDRAAAAARLSPARSTGAARPSTCAGALRDAVRNDGEVMRLPRLRRRLRQRRGAAADRRVRLDEAAHRRATALRPCARRAVERAEVFTIGTRLTRVTRALRLKNREQALAAASHAGRRLGRRHAHRRRAAGLSGGAALCRLCARRARARPVRRARARRPCGDDGGGRAAVRAGLAHLLADAARRRSALCGRRPTRSRSILPLIDDLADGSSTKSLCAHVLQSRRRANRCIAACACALPLPACGERVGVRGDGLTSRPAHPARKSVPTSPASGER